MRFSLIKFAVFALFSISGCGKEAGRIAFPIEGAHEATMELKAGEVALWTDIDLEFEGDSSLTYKVDLVQNGASAGTAVCDPLRDLPLKTGWVSTDIGSSHSRKGTGKMRCDLKLAQGGATTVKATLAWAARPAKITLRKADLVVKQ